jgi:hypothetical protein
MANKALIAAEFGGQKIEYPTTFKMGTDNKTPEFLKKNPNGQVPTLDTPDGPLWESTAIAKYGKWKGQISKGHNSGGVYADNAESRDHKGSACKISRDRYTFVA